MCVCEDMVDLLDSVSEKLSSLEYKNLLELVAENHKQCIRFPPQEIPANLVMHVGASAGAGAGAGTIDADLIRYWENVRQRSREWVHFSEQNLQALHQIIVFNRQLQMAAPENMPDVPHLEVAQVVSGAEVSQGDQLLFSNVNARRYRQLLTYWRGQEQHVISST